MVIQYGCKNGHYGLYGQNGHNGPTLNGHKHDFYVCPQKEWPKCRSPVKTVLKKMDPMKSYDQNKKKLIEMVIFGLNPL